jgi:DNA-binding transcriptional MocR family regulator
MAHHDRDAISGRTSREIARSVQLMLAQGVYSEGDRLPTVRALAERLGVGPGTVAAAYRSLSDRGLLTGRGRAGTTVARRRGRSTPRSLAAPTPGVLDLASGNPDRALLPDLRPALAELARDLAEDGRSRGYGEPLVLPELGSTLATWIRAGDGPLGDTTDSLGLTVVGGVLDGLDRTLRAGTRPGDMIVVEDPTHGALLDLVDALGLLPVGIPVDDQGPDPDALAACLAQDRPRPPEAVVLTMRAHNPTGAGITPDRARALFRVLARFPEILIVENDYLGAISGIPLSSVAALGELPRWVHLHGLSKALGPDLRIAALTGDPVSIERIHRQQQSSVGWVPWIIQRLTHRLLTDPGFGTDMVRTSATYARRRETLATELTYRGVRVTSGSGLHLWIEVPTEARAVQAALALGIAIRPGESFRLDSPPAVRLTTAALAPVLAPTVAEILAPLLTGQFGPEPLP